jgi:serine beta-lactamase-like protein LACTB, mitochondrial
LKRGDGKANSYALGWGNGTVSGARSVGHSGSQQGASTMILLVPERRAGVVVLMNLDGADASGLARELMRIVLDGMEAGK